MTGGPVPAKIQLHRISYTGGAINLGILRTTAEKFPMFGIHPIVEQLNRAAGTSMRVISAALADWVLNDRDNWRILVPCAPFLVNAVIGYEEAGCKLKAWIIFECGGGSRVALPTGKYEGQDSIALIAQGLHSADFKKDGYDIVIDVPDSRLVAVPAFPPESGDWHMPYLDTGIPHGKAGVPSADTRRPYRLPGAYVGIFGRGYNDLCGDRRDVYLSYGPSDLFGAVVEISEEDVKKMSMMPTQSVL
jgi:hypothetical protein